MDAEQIRAVIDSALQDAWETSIGDHDSVPSTMDETRSVLAALAAAGLHVVAEGHAVHDGQVWALLECAEDCGGVIREMPSGERYVKYVQGDWSNATVGRTPAELAPLFCLVKEPTP